MSMRTEPTMHTAADHPSADDAALHHSRADAVSDRAYLTAARERGSTDNTGGFGSGV